mmetsp:Transcript_21837/g.28242  ORF Transcript_21837/g.28242 Transcript_21837/m.28242 type:complete len:81 (-) Transcript_21837:694-936(-)
MSNKAGAPEVDKNGRNSQAKHPIKYPTKEAPKIDNNRLLSDDLASSYRFENIAKIEGKTASPRPNAPPRLLLTFVTNNPG